MGDLIIKPEAGGSIKLQNNAGTNALVSDNSGNVTLAGTLTGGTISGGIISSAVTFPAGHIIKHYQVVFKGQQAISNTPSTPPVDSDFILIGTGAGGADGVALTLTCDAPVSSSSKYLITAALHQSRSQDGMLGFRIMYNNSGLGSDTSMINGNGGASMTLATFGRGHPSTTGNAGNYGLAQTGLTYLWSPSSSLTQTIMVKGTNYSGSANHINRDDQNSDTPHHVSPISTLTVQEIAG